jgi:hypothetical protein
MERAASALGPGGPGSELAKGRRSNVSEYLPRPPPLWRCSTFRRFGTWGVMPSPPW